MTWTTHKPTVSGWYWYQENGKNMDLPMPAWVFDTTNMLYACRYGPHELLAFREAHRVDDCDGLWWGPVEVPA